MIEQNVTENQKQPDALKMSGSSRCCQLAANFIRELLITMIAGFTGLGIYQFMLMFGWLPAS